MVSGRKLSLLSALGTRGGGGVIVDLRTGRKSLVPSSEHQVASGLTRTPCWLAALSGPGNPGILGENVLDFEPSLDRKFLYFTTVGTDLRVVRLRISDQRVETITSLKDLIRVSTEYVEMSIAPDGSPVFARDSCYQEIYALNIRWP